MKVGIAGLGSAGSYLLSLLSSEGFDVTGFDPKPENFYIPCGYAVNSNKMKGLLSRSGIDFEPYVFSSAKNVRFSGSGTRDLAFAPRGLCTFDKNRLERDLIRELNWKRTKLNGNYDLIVDATGIARAYLPKVEDFRMHTLEYVSGRNLGDDFVFRYFPRGTGYFWIFPLGKSYHVGAGSDDLAQIRASLAPYDHMLVASRDIRLRPLFSSAVSDKVIGIGESVGTVSPITGEGIIPAMESAELLFDTMRKHDSLDEIRKAYTHALRLKLKRYDRLFKLLTNVRSGHILSMNNLLSIGAVKQDLNEFGIEFRVTSAIAAILRQRS